MVLHRFRWSIGLGAIIVATCGQPAVQPPRAVRSWVAIDGGTLIDPAHQEVRSNVRIVIHNNRIACVGSSEACRIPDNAQRIDARNRWIMPGLVDAHVHVTEEPGPYVPLYLAFGITTVRDLGGYVDSLRALRRRIDAGAEIGPRVFFAGHPVDGSPTAWPQLYPNVPRVARDTTEARAAVRNAVADGADFIKLYGALSVNQVRAAVSEAHAHGRKATIDVWNLHPDSVIAAGVDGFEHRVPPIEPPGPSTRMEWSRNRLGIDVALTTMREKGVALTSTLLLFDRMLMGELPVSEPTFLALSPALRDRSAEMLAQAQPADSARRANRRRSYEYMCESIRLFTAKGGLLLAGTDSYYLTVYPGDLHRELELLVACGATTWQALSAATSSPVQWLGADSLGQVAAGKLADLLILRADPSRDIRNTRQIELIMKNGRVYRPEEIAR